MPDTPHQALTHLDAEGAVRMVDVSEKPVTRRAARASASVRMRPETLQLILGGQAPKGDVLATARVAGVMAAKRTGELIPMCHPLPVEAVSVSLRAAPPDRVLIEASAALSGRTGVEMEAMTAASVAALTLYDMCKAVDRDMVIEHVRLEEKSGGRSGHYRRDAGPPAAPPSPFVRLSSEPIALQEVIDAVLGPGQGALATFTGVVRDHNQGKAVVRLEYEAYPAMVLSTLARIIEGIEAALPGARVAIVHREGVLHVGDVAVVIAASAPHRAEAFAACRRAIEELKAEVPIWKKEISPDGEAWLGMRP